MANNINSVDDSLSHFESLCSMVERLDDDLPCGDMENPRDICVRCKRPSKVCLCEHIPHSIGLKRNDKIWVFQHPYEQKRVLRTTRILEICLKNENFEILISRTFSTQKFPELKQVYDSENTYVLYPSDKSLSLDDFKKLVVANNDESISSNQIEPSSSSPSMEKIDQRFNIIIIDGTWSQASGIFFNNQDLIRLKQIKIDTDYKSAYVIRTQPREFFLSTLETIAVILATLEENSQIYDDLVRPLKALCDYQLNHGAQEHQSKEYLIFNGLYTKPLSKKMFNQLTKDSKFHDQDDLCPDKIVKPTSSTSKRSKRRGRRRRHHNQEHNEHQSPSSSAAQNQNIES